MKKCLIQHHLSKMTVAALAAVVALLAPAHANANTAWVHGGNWADINGSPAVIHYWAGISNTTTLVQATNVADTIARDYTSVGINFVRIGITPATVASNWPVAKVCINELVAKGLNVDLCCFYIDWKGNGTITNMSLWKTMWQTVDGVYKYNDSVYYEPINEPFGYSLSDLESLYLTFLSSYGIQKSQNHILLDGTGYADSVTGIGTYSSFNNCLLAVHDYAYWNTNLTTAAQWQSQFQTEVGTYSDRTIMTEMGATTDTGLNYLHSANDHNISFTRAVCNQCRSWGMGFAYFPATIPRNGNGTINDKLLFDRVGGAITNHSMMCELQYGWQLGNSNTRADFNGDGQDDYVFFRPTDGTWHITYSSSLTTNVFQFGTTNDVPLVGGDFDGDGWADAVVFRPSTGTWYIRYSSNGGIHSFQFGTNNDIPLLGGDLDGDGWPDAVVFRPSDGTWHCRFSSEGNGSDHVFQYGTAGDIPMLNGDFDGDGYPDACLFRPSTGTWYGRFSSNQSSHSFQFGTNTDIPVLGGDYDGDGTPDAMIFRPSDGSWHIRYSSEGNGSDHVFQWGTNGDIPWTSYTTLGGTLDQNLYRPSTGRFYVRNSITGSYTSIQLGTSMDIPVH